MKQISNLTQNNPESFEISQWFSSILDRIDNIQIHHKYLMKWRNLALNLKQTKRLEKIKYVQYKYRQKKCSRSSKENWISLYSKLWHRKKKKLFNIAKKQLDDAKQKAEDLRRAKRILLIPETDSESEYNSSNSHSNFDQNSIKLNDNQYNNLSPNARKWISMSQRFLSQTKYNELLQAYQNYLDELKYQKQERRYLWKEMANTLVWNIAKKHIKISCKKLKQSRENWKYLFSNYLLSTKLEQIKKVYSKWNSRSLKTDTQIRRRWNRFYFSMRFKQNIIRMVRESCALSTLTNFFRYIILIRRSAAVANYFPIRYIANIRSMVKKSTYESADKISKFASKKVIRDNDIFAFNWSNCIAEAFSSVASHQIGPPVSIEQRKNKIKQKSKNHKKTSNQLSNSITVQSTPSNTISQQQKEQESPQYPIKIIKITRDYDPNEEESDREIITYLSESNGSSDSGSDKPHEKEIKNKDKMSFTEINNKNQQTVIITYPKEKPKVNNDVSIEINPSRSQSTGSVDEFGVSENTDNNNNKSQKEIKVDSTLFQGLKPDKKKKRKQKELLAPIVIPKGKKSLSPIKKKRLKKPFNEEINNPSISDILNIVGIESSLELLDEGSESDISNSSSIHFRFDDDMSDPNSEPLKDLVVDLINITTSDEERRIHQSLLEASQASSNPPNEDDYKKLPNLKDEKIDLLGSSQNNIANAEAISTSPSYNSNSDYAKEKELTDNKSNGIENDPAQIEEEEEEDETIAGLSISDKKTDILNNIEIIEEEEEVVMTNPSINDKKTNLLNDIKLRKEEEDLDALAEEEEDKSCQFNFESEKLEDKNSNKVNTHSNSLNDPKNLEGPSDSYISDRDVDAAMHEYSSDEAAK